MNGTASAAEQRIKVLVTGLLHPLAALPVAATMSLLSTSNRECASVTIHETAAIASPLAVVCVFADGNNLVVAAGVAHGCRSILPITRRDSLAVRAA